MTVRYVTPAEWMAIVQRLDLARELNEKAKGPLSLKEKLAMLAAAKELKTGAMEIGQKEEA